MPKISRGAIRKRFNGRYQIDITIKSKRYRRVFDTLESAEDCLEAISDLKNKVQADNIIKDITKKLQGSD